MEGSVAQYHNKRGISVMQNIPRDQKERNKFQREKYGLIQKKQQHYKMITLRVAHHLYHSFLEGCQKRTLKYSEYEQPKQGHMGQATAGAHGVPQVTRKGTRMGMGRLFTFFNRLQNRSLVDILLHMGYLQFWIHAPYLCHDKREFLLRHLILSGQ